MVKVLSDLQTPFHVAAGSHMELLRKQFFEPLYLHRFTGRFDAFVSNGAIRYHCEYTSKMSVAEIERFDIRNHLGEKDYGFLISALNQTLQRPEFILQPPLRILGDTIAYRISMVNLCPIGRIEVEGREARENRSNFVQFDKATGYRQAIIAYLKMVLNDLIKTKDLVITLGGETSFDIGIYGEDKTKAIKALWNENAKKVIFIGDALYDGGNDAAIREFIDALPPNQRHRADYYQVESYEETITLLKNLGFVH
jgi:hydroxymethylpyrimidine pyrophosphatase-like HAD family hydrolase